MPDKTLSERLPSFFPTHDESTDFYEWLDVHESEIESLNNELEQVKKSLQIAHATGQSLDLIGEDFGLLGERRGRSDTEYQSYLLTLVQAFGGRGRAKDVEFAVSSGLVADESEVEVLDDFANNEYELRITDWTQHTSGIIRELADLADPAAIPLRDPIHNILTTGTPITQTSDVQHQELDTVDTFGTGTFDGEGTFS
jgi:hypothetical protein